MQCPLNSRLCWTHFVRRGKIFSICQDMNLGSSSPQPNQYTDYTIVAAHKLAQISVHRNTGRFIMFSVITNTYNKKTKGPTVMELFTATGKLKKFFFDNQRRSMCAPRVTRHTSIWYSSSCHTCSGVPRNFFRGGSTNSVEDRENGDLGGGNP